MAQKLDIPRPRRRTFYPWKDWLDGSIWRAEQGVDFTTTIPNFQTVLHMRARQEGMEVITGSPEKGIVEFQFKSRTPSKVPVGPST